MFYMTESLYVSSPQDLARYVQSQHQLQGWELVQAIPPTVAVTPNMHSQPGTVIHAGFPYGDWTFIFRRLLEG